MNRITGNTTNTFALLVLLVLPQVLLAQDEYIAPLKNNPVIKAALMKQSLTTMNAKTAAADDTLYLPFFDDFSRATVWPSAERWTDSTAFVNFNFPINPPTVGVATFDGLDATGNPYNNTSPTASGLCDEMTSRYINLAFDDNGLPYDVSDSIALIFYYQRKGRGDNPETNDSLVLQFYDPALQSWASVWNTIGTPAGDTLFTKVKVSINDPAYRQNGFRFRFRNYGSKNGLLDIWNVDYVFLNKFLPPDYEVITDYAYVYEGATLLNSYSAVPWKHFNSLPGTQQQALVRSDAPLTIRNNNNPNSFPIKVAGNLYDLSGGSVPIVGGGGLNNIVIPLNTNVVPPATINPGTYFQYPSAPEQAIFTAVYDIGQTSGGVVDDFPQNDTLIFEQNFHDYYAYDDGSAELAYGINGIGAQLAYKFTTLKADTLRAVNFFWAQSGLSVTNQIFRLAIWIGGSAGPVGAPFYEKFNQTPNYIDSINGFYTYQTDPILLPAGTYFFGFIQNNAVLLNLGLDVNTPADQSKKFINTNGAWVNSQLPGMWMIRPVFDSDPLYTSIDDLSTDNDFAVYPNPAFDVLNIDYSGESTENLQTSITDLSGRVVYESVSFVNQLNISQLSSGLYFLNFRNRETGIYFSRKIIISH